MQYQDLIAIQELPEPEHLKYWRYDVHFFGKIISTTVTSDPLIISEWIEEVKNDRGFTGLVGIKVKCFRDTFATVLQLCYNRYCLIIKNLMQLQYIPFSLHQFLNDPNHTFVTLADLVKDAETLSNVSDLLRIPNSRLIDIRAVLAVRFGEWWLAHCDLLFLLRRVYSYPDIKLSYNVMCSDWNTPDLNLEQVIYASVEAHFAYRLGFDFQVHPPPPPPPPPSLPFP